MSCSELFAHVRRCLPSSVPIVTQLVTSVAPEHIVSDPRLRSRYALNLLISESGIRGKPMAMCGPRISSASEFGEGLPRWVLPGPPPHSQGTQEKGTEEHDNADEQQEQQALDDDTHEAEHDRHDHEE
jgi:hypothetical protein